MDFIITIVNAIIGGTEILVPLLFIVYTFKIQLPKVNTPVLIRAVNCIILLGAVLYTILEIIEPIISFYSGGEYEQYVYSNRLFGPYWFAFWMIVTAYVFVPQILWFEKLQKSIKSSVVVVVIWYALSLLIKAVRSMNGWYFEWGSIFIEYAKDLFIYMIILSGVYWVLIKRTATSKA